MASWIDGLKGRTPPGQESKQSSVGNLIACNVIGQPQWTPRRFENLSYEGYQKNVIVYRSVNLIAKGVGITPWLLYKGDLEIETHSLLTLLNHPNLHQSGSSFFEGLVSYLLLSGNVYIEAVGGREGEGPLELHLLRPDRMKVIPGPQGIPNGYEYSVGGQTKRIPVNPLNGQSQICHIKAFHPLNDWYGMSPIEAAATAIDQHNAVGGHNLALLQNGGRPSGALMVKQPQGMAMGQEQREVLRQDLKHAYEGATNAGRVLVLEGDFEWQEMGLSPKDLDFIEGKNLSAREIAQAYGVPPMLVGVPGDATFANYKEARFHMWEDTILPLLNFLCDELNRWLSPQFGEGLRIGYDEDGIPALAPRREAHWAKIASADFLTVNEKRQAVGYTPLMNGDA